MNSDIILNMGKYTYVARFRPGDKKGRYIAYFPSLPGCATQGESLTEAIEMAKDALALYLSYLKDKGLKVPVEKLLPKSRSRIDIPLSVKVA